MFAQAGNIVAPSSQDFVYGLAGSACSLTLGSLALAGTYAFLQQHSVVLPASSGYYSYFASLSNVENPLIWGMLRTSFIVYVVVLIPLIESFFFHHMLFGWQEEGDRHPTQLSSRIWRIFSNACIFGSFHFSLFAGWVNVPIFVVTTIAGLAFATLREMRGNVRATTIAHMINNAAVLMVL